MVLYEEDRFDEHEPVECEDECSEFADDADHEPWSGPLSECAEKEVWYYGQKIQVAVCPKCGCGIRSQERGSGGWGSDPDRIAERQQMGICD